MTLTPLLKVGQYGALTARGLVSHGKVVKNLAESYPADRRSSLPVNLVPKPGLFGQLGRPAELNTTGDVLPSKFTGQKGAVMQCLHL